MIRGFAAAALTTLCACGEQAPTVPQPSASASPAATIPAAPTSRQIGTTSGLSAQTSALTGDVSGFRTSQTEFGTRVELAADTLFDFDKAALSPGAQTNLQRTAELIRGGGAGPVAVIGYTDAKGSEAYNLDLSRRRADAVVAWFKAQPGLATRAFEPSGRGAADPVAPNSTPDGKDDPAGRAKNRRVVVDIPK